MRRRFSSVFLVLIALAQTPACAVTSGDKTIATESGYSMLRLFLVDEHYLTAIRRVKSVLSFGGISKATAVLVDEIAVASETALRQLESHAAEPPVIVFHVFDETNLAITTFDALRYAMARQLFLDSDNFEKNLLLSQIQILPVVIQLCQQLESNENNSTRKQWLRTLKQQYTDFYKRTQSRLELAPSKD